MSPLTCHTQTGQQGALGPKRTPSGGPAPVSLGECRRAAGMLKEKLECEVRREEEHPGRMKSKPWKVTYPHPTLHHQEGAGLGLGTRQLGAQGLGSPRGRAWVPRLPPVASGHSCSQSDSSNPQLQKDTRGCQGPPPPGGSRAWGAAWGGGPQLLSTHTPTLSLGSLCRIMDLLTNSCCASKAFPELVSSKICTV